MLAVDTATEACSAAVHVDGRVLAHHVVAGRSHTERLMPMVKALMAEAGISFAQLDAYACGVGPGSFAGVRIGVGFVKGLALAVDRPVIGTSSLAMLALPALRAGATRVVSAIDARLDEVYVGRYALVDGVPQLLAPETVCPPVAVPGGGEDDGRWAAVGSGWGRYEAELRAAMGIAPLSIAADALPRAEDGLVLALSALEAGQGISADALAPAYLRNKVALTLHEQQALRRR